MRKFILALVALTAIIAPVALATAPADAAVAKHSHAKKHHAKKHHAKKHHAKKHHARNAPCVTRAEYQRVHVGDTQAQVRAVFGTPGHETSSSIFTTTDWVSSGSEDFPDDGAYVTMDHIDSWREYRKCGSWHGWNRAVSVNFDDYSNGPAMAVFMKLA